MNPILILAGTRPEVIKLAPLYLELRRRGLPVCLCTTGQHTSLLAGALSAFDLSPELSLPPIVGVASLGELTGRLLCALTPILIERTHSAVIVQGDTATAFAGAMAGFYARIPVMHVEAGLRTGHMDCPFPEEYHRRSIALIAKEHFAPTKEAEAQLLFEGIPKESIHRTGNTAVDALRLTLAREDPNGELEIPEGKRLLLFTAHRRESLGSPLSNMLRALVRLVEEHPDIYAICPLHPNPAVRQKAEELLDGRERIRVIDPPDTVRFHHLLARAYLILTDSGGIQEEAVSLGIPTVVMRYATERQEGIRAGVLRLAGSGEEGIVHLGRILLTPDSEEYRRMRHPSPVFGDGHASERIADILETIL